MLMEVLKNTAQTCLQGSFGAVHRHCPTYNYVGTSQGKIGNQQMSQIQTYVCPQLYGSEIDLQSHAHHLQNELRRFERCKHCPNEIKDIPGWFEQNRCNSGLRRSTPCSQTKGMQEKQEELGFASKRCKSNRHFSGDGQRWRDMETTHFIAVINCSAKTAVHRREKQEQKTTRNSEYSCC